MKAHPVPYKMTNDRDGQKPSVARNTGLARLLLPRGMKITEGTPVAGRGGSGLSGLVVSSPGCERSGAALFAISHNGGLYADSDIFILIEETARPARPLKASVQSKH